MSTRLHESAPPRRAQRLAAASVVVALAAAGCATAPADPEVRPVRTPAPPEEAPPERLLLVYRVEAPAGASALRVPLPGSDRWQTVRTLAVDVPSPGRLLPSAASVEGQDRDIEVAFAPDGPGATVVVRAVVERPALAGTALPAVLGAIPSDLGPEAWAEAAAARGVQARVSGGWRLEADGAPVPRRWAEVLLSGTWTPVADGKGGLPERCVRLSTLGARARVGEREVDAPVRAELAR